MGVLGHHKSSGLSYQTWVLWCAGSGGNSKETEQPETGESAIEKHRSGLARTTKLYTCTFPSGDIVALNFISGSKYADLYIHREKGLSKTELALMDVDIDRLQFDKKHKTITYYERGGKKEKVPILEYKNGEASYSRGSSLYTKVLFK